MKRILTSLFAFALLLVLLQGNANAQLTGTKTIPGTYATIAAAITDLNAQGVGAGGVTFNISPGYTETVPSGGLIINITSNQPTSGNPVVFQRNGAGANPIIQSDGAGSGTIAGTSLGSNGDALVWLVGTDYITFNNLSFVEQYTGATQTLKMEYCIVMVRGSATDGCKNVTISGCTFQQQQSDIYSSCISSGNRNQAGTTTNPTDRNGIHENISVQGCTFNNSFNAMYFLGYSSAAPYDLFENGINIGNVTGNTLRNIGSGFGAGTVNAGSHYGIYTQYCDSIKVNNNDINVNTWTNNSTHYGILCTTALSAMLEINNNTVSDTSLGTGQHGAIASGVGYSATGPNNSVTITNNTVKFCYAPNITSSSSLYVYSFSNPFSLTMSNNLVDSCKIGGTGTATGGQYGVYSSSSQTTAGATYTITNNTVRNLSRTQSAAGAGNTYCMYILGGGATTNISGNSVYNITNSTATGTMAGIYFSPTVTEVNVFNNTVRDMTKDNLTGTTGTMYGIYQSTTTPTCRNYNNNIYNLSNYGTTATIYGYYNFGSMATGIEEVYNNTIHDIKTKGSSTCIAMNIATGLSGSTITKNVYGNLVYNIRNDSIGQTGGIRVDYVTYGNIYNNRVYNVVNAQNDASLPAAYGMLLGATITGANYDVYNNMVSEVYAPISNSALGVLGVWINGGDTANVSYNTIYMDSSATGTNTGNYALYLAGTTNATMKNNIIVNNFTPAGTGGNIAIFKATGVVYNTASNNNNVYVPTGALNYFYYDGTTTYATFAAYQAAVTPAETNSFAENSPFMNVSTHPYNLDMKTTVPTLCESGGIPIPGITTDIHGTTRNAVTPDVGADEFLGLKIPLGPSLVFPANNATNVIPNHPKIFNWNKSIENYRPVRSNGNIQSDAISNYWIELYADTTGAAVFKDSTVTDTTYTYNPDLTQLTPYWWRVKAKNELGWGDFSGYFKFTTDVIDGLGQNSEIPTVYDLFQNYPNPFNPTTSIRFDIPKSGFVSLKVYDVTGREVATLVNNNLEPAKYEVSWNGTQFASGVYFYRIIAGDFVKVQKMILVK